MGNPTADDLLREASGLDSSIQTLAGPAGTIFEAVKFSTEFKSPQWPVLDGPIVIRYPSFGDLLKIEAITGIGGSAKEAFATLFVCIEKAPPAWWFLPDGSKVPIVNLEAIPDSDGLLGLWYEFLKWRRSFRGGGSGKEPPAA